MLEFIRKVSDSDKAAILAAMQEVRREGTRAARHLRGDLFEVRADGERAFNKKTQRTPPQQIELAARRLRDWRSRARPPQAKADDRRHRT